MSHEHHNWQIGKDPPLIRPHILPLAAWQEMARRLANRDVDFTLSPRLSFAGRPAEQHIMMLADGCGNVVEFKSQPHDRVFATDRP